MDKRDKRQKLEEEKARIEAQLKLLDQKAKDQARRDDTRRKVITGALALENMEIDEEFRRIMHKLMNRYVKPIDRHLFDFLEDRGPAPSETPVAEFTAAAEQGNSAASDQSQAV